MYVTGCVILRTIPCCSNPAHCHRSGPAQMHSIVWFLKCDHARFHTRVAMTFSCHQIHQVLQMAANVAHDSRDISPTTQTNTEGPSPSFSSKAHIRSAPAFSYLGEVGEATQAQPAVSHMPKSPPEQTLMAAIISAVEEDSTILSICSDFCRWLFLPQFLHR